MFPEEQEKTDPSIDVPMPGTTHEREAPAPQPVARTLALDSMEIPLDSPSQPDPFAVDSSPDSHVSRKAPMPPPPPPAPARPADISVGALLALGALVFMLCASATFAAVWAFYSLA